MTNEEAIEILRDTPIDIRSAREDDIHTLYATAQMMAIEALEKQVSKKPAHDEENVFTWLWRCPRCDCRPMQNYCASCGQAIDWSVHEET